MFCDVFSSRLFGPIFRIIVGAGHDLRAAVGGSMLVMCWKPFDCGYGFSPEVAVSWVGGL